MKKALFIISVSAAFFACNASSKKEKTTALPDEDYTLVGKKALIAYPSFKAEVSYLTDSTLHWKTVFPDGKTSEANERIFLKKLNERMYFLNWIEQDGVSISQVVDLRAKIVTVFAAFSDEQSKRGKRNGALQEGKLEFIK